MTTGCDQLSPDEYLLRRIPAIQVDKTLPCPIHPEHFNPHKERDKDGISFFREAMVSANSLVANAQGKGPYYVARAKVKDLNDLGLHPVITDAPDHTSTPELRYDEVQKNDEASRILKLKLAELMSREIVLGPMSPSDAKNAVSSAFPPPT